MDDNLLWDLGELEPQEPSKSGKWDGRFFIDYLGLTIPTLLKEEEIDDLIYLMYLNPNKGRFRFLIKNLEAFTNHVFDKLYSEEANKLEPNVKEAAERFASRLSLIVERFKEFDTTFYSGSDLISFKRNQSLIEILSSRDSVEELVNRISDLTKKEVDRLDSLDKILQGSMTIVSLVKYTSVDNTHGDEVMERLQGYQSRNYLFTPAEREAIEFMGYPKEILGSESLMKPGVTTNADKVLTNLARTGFLLNLVELFNLVEFKKNKVDYSKYLTTMLDIVDTL